MASYLFNTSSRFMSWLASMVHAASVGTSAPSGGPAVLNALCSDAGWRMLYAREIPGLKHPPSPLDVPDPNRPVKVGSGARIRDPRGLPFPRRGARPTIRSEVAAEADGRMVASSANCAQ